METIRYSYEDLQLHNIPLPWDIDREMKAGYYQTVRKMIGLRLTDPAVPEVMKTRLQIALDDIRCILDRFSVSPEEGVACMIERGVKDFTLEELEELRLKGVVDWRYVEGQVRYLDSFAGSLVMYPEFEARIGKKSSTIAQGGPSGVGDEPDAIETMIQTTEDGEEMAAHIHIRHSLQFEKVEEGRTLIVHMPIPKSGINDQMRNIQILSSSHTPVAIAEGDSLQPTMVFREPARDNMAFSLEYELDHVLTYHDLGTDAAYERVTRAMTCAETEAENGRTFDSAYRPEDSLGERLPHIVFTPYIRSLVQEIIGEETHPLRKARACYDFVTTHVKYRFAPNYAEIDNVSEFCARNLRGDCGIQALLLITLLRACGIPARWQSGLVAEPGEIGEHDWVRFWLPGMGWLFADPSAGGSAYWGGNSKNWNFYFGNLDPFRLPLNEEVQEHFVPEMKYPRYDPCDSQDGEAEYEDGPCRDVNYPVFEDLGIRTIERGKRV